MRAFSIWKKHAVNQTRKNVKNDSRDYVAYDVVLKLAFFFFFYVNVSLYSVAIS